MTSATCRRDSRIKAPSCWVETLWPIWEHGRLIDHQWLNTFHSSLQHISPRFKAEILKICKRPAEGFGMVCRLEIQQHAQPTRQKEAACYKGSRHEKGLSWSKDSKSLVAEFGWSENVKIERPSIWRKQRGKSGDWGNEHYASSASSFVTTHVFTAPGRFFVLHPWLFKTKFCQRLFSASILIQREREWTYAPYPRCSKNSESSSWI